MWDNIGHKLQSLAKVLCWLGIIGSVITAIVLWSQTSYYRSTIFLGFLYLIIGCLASWIGSWAMYGLGLVVEYVENGGSHSSSSGYMSNSSSASDNDTPMARGSYWTCPKCKTRNPFSRIECKECGELRQ